MTDRLAGKVALVSGGAQGIGAAIATRFAAEGATAIVADIDEAKGQATVAMILAAGGRGTFLRLDVTSEDSWTESVAILAAEPGRLDILVNNAGIGFGALVTDTTLDQWRRQQAINVEGVFLGIKHALPLMRRGSGGSIINMSSVAGVVGIVGMSAYCATKGAVALFTKAVAVECAALRDGVRVNSLHPGMVETAIWGDVPAASVLPGIDTTAFLGAGGRLNLAAVAGVTVPLGRPCTVDEVAAAAVYLASDEASYTTGAALMLDGGMAAR